MDNKSYLVVDKGNKSNNEVFVIDVLDRKFKVVDYSRVKHLENLDDTRARYVGEEIDIADSVGVLAYINKDDKVYGIFQTNKQHELILSWITIDDFSRDTDKDKVCNLVNEPLDITQFGREVYKPGWFSSVKLRHICSLHNGQIKVSDFLSKVDNNNMLEKYRELDNKIDELNKLKMQLNNLLNKLSHSDYINAIEELVEIDNVYTFDDNRIEKKYVAKEDIVYEMLLRGVSYGDIITISKDYFSKLKVYLKKTLESNLSYSKYRAIAVIKLEENSSYNVLAIVDYDESLDTMKLTILKPYGAYAIDDNDIDSYYIEYRRGLR